jgi:hypothetical protein
LKAPGFQPLKPKSEKTGFKVYFFKWVNTCGRYVAGLPGARMFVENEAGAVQVEESSLTHSLKATGFNP